MVANIAIPSGYLNAIACLITGAALIAGCSFNESARDPAQLPGRADGSLVQLVDLHFGWGIQIGLATDKQGNVYVADSHRNRIVRVGSDGAWAVIAGAGEPGYRDGPGAMARFSFPQGLAVDDGGNVFVADTLNEVIRKISARGEVTTIAGSYRWYHDGNVRDRNPARDGLGKLGQTGPCQPSRGFGLIPALDSSMALLIKPLLTIHMALLSDPMGTFTWRITTPFGKSARTDSLTHWRAACAPGRHRAQETSFAIREGSPTGVALKRSLLIQSRLQSTVREISTS